jgi:hypothetical protein
MTDRNQSLIALAARVEAATGPDRELDLAISVAIDYRDVFNGPLYKPYAGDWRWGAGGDEIEHWTSSGKRDGFLDPAQFVPRWTASLDAAMTLVPEGMQWFKERGAYVPNIAVIQGPTCSFVGETDSTFALALCAAALRARGASQ